MISVLTGLRRAWTRLPDNALKSGVSTLGFRLLKSALIRELAGLDIKASGTTSDGVPYVRLGNDLVFHGYPPDELERRVCDAIRESLPPRLHPEAFRVCIDIVTRYRYPHALPGEKPPYPYLLRYAFHPQHITTLADARRLDDETRRALARRFTVGPGNVVIEAGSFLGFGAMRLSQLVGDSGRVIAIEALPEAQELLQRNVAENGLDGRIVLIRGAASNTASKMRLMKTSLQANTIIEGMIPDAADSDVIESDTIDNIVDRLGLARVDLVSLTINGAEPEALQGMQGVCSRFAPAITSAGWYARDGRPGWKAQMALLSEMGYTSLKIGMGRVLAWKA